MGVVYRGKDPFIGRTVAIKTITGNFTDNPDLLERFYREARAAGGLQHPNIVTIYDMGEDNGTPYIAMELLEGDDLGHMIEKEKEEGGAAPLPASIKLSYIVQVCRALEFAHKRNIVHRDIKPGNIVVTHEGAVKVVDFGIARLTDTSSTSSGMLIGTIDYMSPEQIRGEKVDGRSDIWAVGVMIYEILTYTKPFQGGNITAVMFSIVSQEPKSIRELRPDLPVEMDGVMRRIFKKEPGERYQNMDELLGELEPIVRRMQQESVGMLVTQSENLLKSGDLQRAKELLKQALVLDTSHVHAKTLLDRVNSEIRRSEVMPKLNEIVAEAEKLLAAGNFEEARRQADAALHLDSNYMPARELLGKVQEAQIKAQVVSTGLREARQRLAEGGLTEAEQSLEKVLQAAPDNQEAALLRKEIAEEKERRGKRKQLAEGVQKARKFWTGQQFDEALRVLEELGKTFPNENEVLKLLEAVRADKAQDEIQKTLAEARRLLTAQSFNESLAALDRLLQRYPNESAAVKLRELVLQEREEHARVLRLQKEVESLKKLVNEEKFDDAISNGEALLKEFPGDFELSRLVEFARAQQAQKESLRKRQARQEEINGLVQAGDLEKALANCQQALKDFPGDAEFKQRLEQITTLQKEAKERERQKLLDDRLRKMRQLIERGDLTEAIDVGNKTVFDIGRKDTDLTKLVEMAKRERSFRDLRRTHDEQTLKAIDLIEDKKFEEAAKILRVLDRDEIIDPRIPVLQRAAEDRRVPTQEELALMRSKPVQGAEDAGATRVAGLGPRPVVTPGLGPEGGGATRVFHPESLEETSKFKGPLTAPPAPPAPAPAPVAVNAAAVAPPTPVEEKTTIVPPVGEVTTVKPPVDEKTLIKTPVEEKTTIQPPKEEKKLDKKEQKREEERRREEERKQKEQEKEQQREREKELQRAREKQKKAETPMVAPPVAAAPAAPAIREVKPPGPAQTLAPAASVAVPAPPAERPKPAAPPVVEEKREAPPRKPAFEAAVALPAEKKGGGMGLIIGGVVAVAVIAGGVYMFLGKKAQPTTETAPPTATSTQPAGGTSTSPPPAPAVVEKPVVPTGPSPDEKKATEMISLAMKAAAKGDYDGGKKKLAEAENFVKSKNLGGNFLTTIQSDNAQIDKIQSNAALRATLNESNTLFDSANSAIGNGQWDQAGKTLDKLQGLGEGAAHKDEVPNLRGQIEAGKKLDAQFTQAQSQANSRDRNTLASAKATLDAIASANGRHASEARNLSTQVGKAITEVDNAASAAAAAAANAKAEQQRKIDTTIADIRKLKDAHNFSAARAKLSDLQGLGVDPSPYRAEIDSTEKGMKTAACTVGQVAHQKYTAPFKAGDTLGQPFLDGPLQLSAGTNCGLSLDDFAKGEWRVLLKIDAEGKVTDGNVLVGDAGAGAKIITAAKSSWHFDAPKVNGQPVKTSAAVTVRVN